MSTRRFEDGNTFFLVDSVLKNRSGFGGLEMMKRTEHRATSFNFAGTFVASIGSG
jgi:hypothetical protein